MSAQERHSERCPRCGQFVQTVKAEGVGGWIPLQHFEEGCQ